MKRLRTPWEPVHRAAVRHRVAIEAARMLYHREVKEYWHAKREAARRQGTLHLPSNAEVHEQLLLIARKVDAESHHRRLVHMRATALQLMECMAAFRPRLIGSVLTGHIRQGSDIDLHAYTDDVDLLVETLEAAGHGVAVEVVSARKSGELRDFTHIRFEAAGHEVEITVYPPADLQTSPRCGITGGTMRRATTEQLRQLLAEVTVAPVAAGGPQVALPLQQSQILALVPELHSCRGVMQNHYHHLDVYDHTWAVLSGLERMVLDGFTRFGPYAARLVAHVDVPFLCLAGACHDLGKPTTQSMSRDGRFRFFGHEHVSADMVRLIGRRVGLDAASTDDLARVVDAHLEAVRIPAEDAEPSRIHRLMAAVGERVPELALLSLADVEAARGPAQSAARLEAHEQFVRFLLAQYFEDGFLMRPVLPVSADDLRESFGVLEARTVSRLLEALLDDFVDGEFEGREEGLSLAAEMLSDPQGFR